MLIFATYSANIKFRYVSKHSAVRKTKKVLIHKNKISFIFKCVGNEKLFKKLFTLTKNLIKCCSVRVLSQRAAVAPVSLLPDIKCCVN